MDFEKEDVLENPDWEYVGTYTDIKSGRTISSRPGFQGLLTLHAGIAQAESENKSENILTNEKYTGASLYGETESAEFPSTKRTVREPFKVHRSRNHHLPIIHERHFKRVLKLKAKYDAPRQLSNSPIGEATAFGALGLGIFIFMQKVVIAK